ncbi:MAG TPA: LysE family translocator [Chryseosolibacter sp.]
MDTTILLSFLLASIALTLMPGPDNIFVLTESITRGYVTGVWLALGLSSGIIVHTLLLASGLSLILVQSATALTILKFLGSAYLIWLAVQAARETAQPVSIISPVTGAGSPATLVKKGFLMNVLNPKVSVFFIAFLPQFLTESQVAVGVQLMILGLIFLIQAFLIFSCIALLCGRLHEVVNKPKFWIYTKWSKVAVTASLALALFF